VARIPALRECSLLEPEVAALIHATDMHVEHLRVCPALAATVRLDELATFVDLCSLPGFRLGFPADLAKHFEPYNVLPFARCLAVDLLGKDPFQGCEDRWSLPSEHPRIFPRPLVDGLCGMPIDLGWQQWISWCGASR
jgi:hypothetical protein